MLDLLRRRSDIRLERAGPSRVRLVGVPLGVAVALLATALGEADAQLVDFHWEQPSLEEAFVRLTGLDAAAMLQDKGGGR